jgi:hypothetical protein
MQYNNHQSSNNVCWYNLKNFWRIKMKKQLLIAAVAASMTSVAMADVSISGEYEGIVSQNTGAASFAQDLDLTVVGTSGGSSVTMTLEDITGGADIAASQVFLKTNLEGVSFKAGKYESTNGNGILAAATNKNRIGLSTTVAGFGVGLTNASGDANGSVTVSGTIAGASVKVQNALNSTRFVTISGDVAGVAIAVERQKTATGTNTGFNLSTDINGVAVAYENVKINDASAVSQDDGMIGDISSATVKASAISASMATAMGSVEVKHAKIDSDKTMTVELTRGNVVYGYSKTTDLDKVLSAKVSFSF